MKTEILIDVIKKLKKAELLHLVEVMAICNPDEINNLDKNDCWDCKDIHRKLNELKFKV